MILRVTKSALCLLTFAAAVAAPAPAAPAITIDARVAVASLMSLADGHFKTMADTLETLADTDEARSGNWDRIRGLLAQAGRTNVAAVLTYARPDGTYWTVQSGLQTAKISDRAYFREAMGGQTVIGQLVKSRSTGRPVAVIAVPVFGGSHRVTGILGAAVYLDSLSALLKREMALNDNDIFYSFDANALVGVNWDPKQIMLEPRRMSPELDRAFGEMLKHDSGVETYPHRGKYRTVVYVKSPVTRWWYAFGVVH